MREERLQRQVEGRVRPRGPDRPQRVGDERAARAWRCRGLRHAGAYLALGSDWPIAHHDARQVLATARAPRGAASARPGLNGLMALEGMTTHAAVAAGEERSAGRIAPGCRTDLTAFTVGAVTAPADETEQAPVRLTTAGGRITYRT